MNIGLDYDGTITEDPDAWLEFCQIMVRSGHNIWIVTMRYPSEGQDIDDRFYQVVKNVVYTNRQPKRAACQARGIDIHVWIDDNPEAVTMSASQIWGRASDEGDVVIEVHGKSDSGI